MAAQFAPDGTGLPHIAGTSIFAYAAEVDTTVPGLTPVVSFLNAANRGQDKIVLLHNSVDPTVTRAGHFVRIAKEVDDYSKSYSEGATKARRALAESTAQFEKMLSDKVGIKPTATSDRLQDRLNAMSDSDREKAVRKAFADDDKELLGAIIGANFHLHRCDPKYVLPLHNAYRQKVAPDLYNKIEHHRKISVWLDMVDREALAFMSRAYEGTQDAAKKQAGFATLLASYGD